MKDGLLKRVIVDIVVIFLTYFVFNWSTIPKRDLTKSGIYDFVIVTDLDERSRDPEQFVWYAYLKYGKLHRRFNGNYTVEWTRLQKLESHIAKKNRSMELSDLIKLNDVLYGMCDTTGIVFKITPDGKVYQRYAIADGDGNDPKPMKIEWATVKDGLIYVGSIGKEWVHSYTSLSHYNCEWIKTISKEGVIENHNWAPQYTALRIAANATFPNGYLLHEAVSWNPNIQKWLFLPRRYSTDTPYSVENDERQGGNTLFIVDETFEDIKTIKIGEKEPHWGFTSIKIVPDSNDVIALKVKEADGKTQTEMTVFDLDGNFKMEPTSRIFVSEMKFEGVEFV